MRRDTLAGVLHGLVILSTNHTYQPPHPSYLIDIPVHHLGGKSVHNLIILINVLPPEVGKRIAYELYLTYCTCYCS